MLLDVFRCLQKVIIVVNMVTRKKIDCRGPFRTHSNICGGAYLIVKGFQPSTFSARKLHARCSNGF